MKNILPKIAFTICATVGTSLIDNDAIANIDRSNNSIDQVTQNIIGNLNERRLSKQFAEVVIKNYPVKMHYSNDEMSQICNDISQAIRDSGYGASCIKDANAAKTDNTLDVHIADDRLKKFVLHTTSDNSLKAKGRFKRAVYRDIRETYNYLRKSISQMYLDGSQEEKANYNSYIQLNNPK